MDDDRQMGPTMAGGYGPLRMCSEWVRCRHVRGLSRNHSCRR
jgi:hypothetical protein